MKPRPALRRRSVTRRTARIAAACLCCFAVMGCQYWRLSSFVPFVGGGCPDCGAGLCIAPGCLCGPHYSRCIDEHVAAREAIKRANRSLKACYSRRPGCDFRDGYRQAFVDIALGGAGQVPAVPPERYWNTCYRTAAGHQRAQNWFAGYVAGAGRALSMRRYQFNEVAASGVPAFHEDAAHAQYASQTAPSVWVPERPSP